MRKAKVKRQNSKGLCHVRITNHDVHVFADPARCRWVVKRGRRTLSRHLTQATAIKNAARTARRHHVDLVTHGTDGRIRSKDSFGNETSVHDTEH